MTLLEELMEKRAAQREALADIFRSKSDTSIGKPIVRKSILRGNSGQDHLIREGETLKNVRRIEKTKEGKSETSIMRLLGLFGADN